VLLNDTDTASGLETAERLRLGIAEMSVPRPAAMRVTASFGVPAPGESDVVPVDWFVRPDRALYAAKADGRNCCRVALGRRLRL
jgi:diguanylate cyclase (GGDEF)-like protein